MGCDTSPAIGAEALPSWFSVEGIHVRLRDDKAEPLVSVVLALGGDMGAGGLLRMVIECLLKYREAD